MNYQQCIERLSGLVHIDILNYALEIGGLIAGGSVVFALNDFVPRETISDIDIFIPSVEAFRKMINYLSSVHGLVIEYMCVWEQEENGIICSIANCFFPNTKKKSLYIQLIYDPFNDPMNLLEFFDTDYVQCGLYKDQVLMTNRCKRSHQDRRVYEFSDIKTFKNFRIMKAKNKGFSIPYVVSYNSYDSDGVFYRECDEELADSLVIKPIRSTGSYLRSFETPNQDITWYSIDSIKVNSFVMSDNPDHTKIGHEGYAKIRVRPINISAKAVNSDLVKDFYVDHISWELIPSHIDVDDFGTNIYLKEIDNNLRIERVRLDYKSNEASLLGKRLKDLTNLNLFEQKPMNVIFKPYTNDIYFGGLVRDIIEDNTIKPVPTSPDIKWV